MHGTTTKGVVPARYWHLEKDGRIQCDLCPRFCKLREGQRGLCFVRAREGDELVLTTWGRSSGFCCDPIEKKPLFHFLPGSSVLSFGTAGCNLACKYCQNWDISRARRTDALAAEATPTEIASSAVRHNCRSVAYTYNDPVIFIEYALDTAEACRAAGVRNVAVTAGYICPEPRVDFFAGMDAANVDLKAFTERFYWKLCGGHLEPVKETLQYLAHETDVWLEVTTLLIPGENDSAKEIERLSDWIAQRLGPHVPLHLTAFHGAWKMQDYPDTPADTLREARSIARRNGLKFVYTGNIYDPSGQTTYCGACNHPVIQRQGYRVTGWKLDEQGRCRSCGSACPGIFDGQPGTWGGRRAPLGLSLH
ncbi:MAG: AmmeMemoRadiSam system radical SAM enzyme [Gammaproteobacteria bacterium]|jgi:pyruvate formate lyase activating enzyme|nr:MAG: radical SAM protein [Gammaproteobacteria bacterium SG8_31]